MACHTLIIEDEPVHGYLVADVIEGAGATSSAFAATEEQALAEARARRPDFIICDVQLRDGRGPDAIERIRSELGDIPVMFVTGMPEDCDELDYAVAVLVKPVSERQLAATFRHHALLAESASPSQSLPAA